MTADDYRACVKAFGLTPCKPSFEGGTIHQDRNGEYIRVIDPDSLSDEEREALIELLKDRLGIEAN